MSYAAVLLLASALVWSVNGQSSTVPSDDEVMKSSASETLDLAKDRFTFGTADAKVPAKQSEAVESDELTKDEAENEALGEIIFETILSGEKDISISEAGMSVTNDVDDKDDDDEDDGDNDNDTDKEDDTANDDDDDEEEDEIDETISSDTPKPPVVQIRRQGDLYTDFDKKEKDGTGFPQPRQDANHYPSPYDSPLLQLTQGGYQRPYSVREPFGIDRQRLGSSPQLSESEERPVVGAQSDGHSPQIVPRVTYANAYQPQMAHPQMAQPQMAQPQMVQHQMAQPQMVQHQWPMFRNPFDPTGSFVNANGPVPNASPINFFNAQPDFFSANVHQSPFARPSMEFSEIPRDLNGFSAYQVSNPSHMFQSPPQIVQTRPMVESIQSPAHNLYQTPSFTPYSGMNTAEPSGPDYSAYFRSPSPMNLPHFQGNPNYYSTLPNGAGINNKPATNPASDSSRFLHYPVSAITPQNTQGQQQNSESTPKAKDSDQIKTSSDKEDPIAVPFGTRIQPQNNSPVFMGPRDVYIRYPMKEAGYATEENLPVQNATEGNVKAKEVFPFLASGVAFPGFSGQDPYRGALNALQQGRSDSGEDSSKEKKLVGEFAPSRFGSESAISREYPERSPFYGSDRVRGPFAFPERNVYPFSVPQPAVDVTPMCAKENNATLCFKDPDYPRRDLLYALNSDSFLLERLVSSDQRLDGIQLVEQNTSESESRPDNYICRSDLKYGNPLRAKNVRGEWKVVVNVERAIGGGKFVQPVRLEVCRSAGDPCSLATEVRTVCVQKYSLHRLLSWSAEKGVHNDVYRLPVACSCQLVK